MSGIVLFKHQKKALRLLKGKKAFALFMEQGTGKTLVMVKKIDELLSKGKVGRIIVFCPDAVVDSWISELSEHLESDCDIIKYTGKKAKRAQILKDLKKNKKPQILVLNYDKSRNDKKQLKKYNTDMCIADESQKIKNYKSGQTKAVINISKDSEYKFILTGTPISKGNEDIFGQFLFMNPKLLGYKYKDFEDKYLIKGGYMNYTVVGYKNEDELKKIIKANSFRVKKRECLDLPPVTEQKIYCDISPKARKVYKELDKTLVSLFESLHTSITRKELKTICKKNKIKYNKRSSYLTLLSLAASSGGKKYEVALDSAMIKVSKLQQITGGFLKTEDGTLILDQSKLKITKEIIENQKNPVVIFCKYVAELKALEDEFKSQGKKVLTISGKVKNKGKVVKKFQKGKTDIIIVQISSGSSGITLTKADTAIFYSWGYKYDEFDQAKARIDRAGQKNPMTLYLLIARDTIDETILEVLEERGKRASNLID